MAPSTVWGRAIFYWLSAIVLAIFPACSSNPSNSPRLLTREQAIAEYRAYAKQLELPPGHEWPDVPVTVRTSISPEAVYEVGVGEGDADLWWYCAWAKYGLTRDQAALRILGQFRQSRVWPRIDAHGRTLFIEIEKGVGAGNVVMLLEYVEANCQD